MSLQQKLFNMLSESFQIARVSADDFVVKSDGLTPVRLHVSEVDLAHYSAVHAADGLLALGEVGNDVTGVTAALGLLSVHIAEKIIASEDDPVTDIAIHGGRLDVRREHARDH